MRHRMPVLLMISLVISTAFVLLTFRESLEPAPAVGAPALGLGVVRAYVSDLNTFIGDGELEAVMSSYDRHAIVRTRNASEAFDAVSLKASLMAIRESYPELVVSLVDTHSQDGAVVAELGLNAMGLQTPAWIEFSAFEPSMPLIDTFRIERGVIVEHQSSLFAWPQVRLLEPQFSEMTVMRKSRLTMAQMSLPAEHAEFVPVPGPVMILVQQGRIEIAGGTDDFLSQAPELPIRSLKSGVREFAGPGAMVVSTVANVSIKNAGALTAKLDVIALPMVGLQVHDGEAGTTQEGGERTSNLTEFALNDAFHTEPGETTRIDGISIVPVARSTETVRIGTGTLLVAFVSLPAGASVTFDDGEGLVAFMPLQGGSGESLEPLLLDGAHLVKNDGADPVRMLVARYDA